MAAGAAAGKAGFNSDDEDGEEEGEEKDHASTTSGKNPASITSGKSPAARIKSGTHPAAPRRKTFYSSLCDELALNAPTIESLQAALPGDDVNFSYCVGLPKDSWA